jgi:SAM-dependent methyltransferase
VLGWDLAQLGPRISIDGPAWDFSAIVVAHARGAESMLDVDTGGGEWLASLAHRPAHTVATESWPPNVDVARKRLEPLGVSVIAAEPVPDNVAPQDGAPPLPCASGAFALVTARHAAYVPHEIARVLTPGGTFLTQQVGGDYGDFYGALGLPRPQLGRRWTLELAAAQLENGGLTVADGAEGEETTTFADAEALGWYLTAVPWTVQGFSAKRQRDELERVRFPLQVRLPAFWLRASSRPR